MSDNAPWHPVRSVLAHPVHAVIGAVAGTVLLPIPIVGTVVGLGAGGWWGHKLKGGWLPGKD